MAVYAVVSPFGGQVTNTIVGDDESVLTEIFGGVVEITEATGPASTGWTWDPEAGKFIAPEN
jgi:hypothetical protein